MRVHGPLPNGELQLIAGEQPDVAMHKQHKINRRFIVAFHRRAA
jgi:hypothetical protein